MLDTRGVKLLDWENLAEFMVANSKTTESSKALNKRMVGLMRRIQCSLNSKISYN